MKYHYGYPYFSPEEERLNFLTHLTGTIISVIGVLILVVISAFYATDNIQVFGNSVFGLCLISVFLSSTLYHGARRLPIKKILQTVDHAAIYLLIAGTYTPFALGNLRHEWGFAIAGIIWVLAILGIIYKILAHKHMDKIGSWDAFIYLFLGCYIFLFLDAAIETVPFWGLFLLAVGGLCYIVGIYFFISKNITYNHVIWHLFVMAGAACHYFSVLLFAAPPAL